MPVPVYPVPVRFHKKKKPPRFRGGLISCLYRFSVYIISVWIVKTPRSIKLPNVIDKAVAVPLIHYTPVYYERLLDSKGDIIGENRHGIREKYKLLFSVFTTEKGIESGNTESVSGEQAREQLR